MVSFAWSCHPSREPTLLKMASKRGSRSISEIPLPLLHHCENVKELQSSPTLQSVSWAVSGTSQARLRTLIAAQGSSGLEVNQWFKHSTITSNIVYCYSDFFAIQFFLRSVPVHSANCVKTYTVACRRVFSTTPVTNRFKASCGL
jgi:hypothetical protein